MTKIATLQIFFYILFGGACLSACKTEQRHTPVISIRPDQHMAVTNQIQHAIDSCSFWGGGSVCFKKGVYLSGKIVMRSNVVFHFEDGAILRGSDNYLDYGDGNWSDALITGDSLDNISFVGNGIIDGVDCKNPNGEEGFRGPHTIRLRNCRKIKISGLTIRNSGNWAINLRHCSDAIVENINIRGGHDGLHTRFCSNFKIRGCDFRTGDDCFAGNDNQNFTIENCRVNTACNGFRLGCDSLLISGCKIWGPGEFKHLSQNRNNMLSAFVHFAPKDENPSFPSNRWFVKDIVIENVDHVFNYNFEKGLWQTGQPFEKIVFDGIKATGIIQGFNIKGDSLKHFDLTIRNSTFKTRTDIHKVPTTFEGVQKSSIALLAIETFDKLLLQNVEFTVSPDYMAIFGKDGRVVNMIDVKIMPSGNLAVELEQIDSIVNTKNGDSEKAKTR